MKVKISNSLMWPTTECRRKPVSGMNFVAIMNCTKKCLTFLETELYRRKRVSVKSNDGAATTFLIRPKKLGPVKIKLKATTTLAEDSFEHSLNIDLEGVEQSLNKALLVDLRDKSKIESNMSIEIPRNAVPDSTRIEVSVLSDIFGSTIGHLDSLIGKPQGCGEQNMLSLVSNIVAINYLKTTNQLTESIEERALRAIDLSYQRELSYKHQDGSFSAFGDTDPSGSTWLTAFVARSFRQAASHIDVERRIIEEALNWLESIQAENGSFPEVGNVIHTDLQQGADNGIALTAYTLIAFLENKSAIPTHRNTINKAMDYIVRNLETLDEVYAMALAAHALQLADHNAKDFVLRIFDSRAIVKDGLKHWAKPVVGSDTKNIWYSRPNSINTEITAYGLLAILGAGASNEEVPILKWLLAQRSELGGFDSTQDTVVGLQALANIGESIRSQNTDIQVGFKYGKGLETRMRVSPGSGIVPQKYEVWICVEIG